MTEGSGDPRTCAPSRPALPAPRPVGSGRGGPGQGWRLGPLPRRGRGHRGVALKAAGSPLSHASQAWEPQTRAPCRAGSPQRGHVRVCSHVWPYACVHVCACPCSRVVTCGHMHLCGHMRVCSHVWSRARVVMCICVVTCGHVSVRSHVVMCVCAVTCMCVCACSRPGFLGGTVGSEAPLGAWQLDTSILVTAADAPAPSPGPHGLSDRP